MYEIIINKIPEQEKNRDAYDVLGPGVMGRRGGYMQLFRATMDADSSIEILQHLHDLKDRKKDA